MGYYKIFFQLTLSISNTIVYIFKPIFLSLELKLPEINIKNNYLRTPFKILTSSTYIQRQVLMLIIKLIFLLIN